MSLRSAPVTFCIALALAAGGLAHGGPAADRLAQTDLTPPASNPWFDGGTTLGGAQPKAKGRLPDATGADKAGTKGVAKQKDKDKAKLKDKSAAKEKSKDKEKQQAKTKSAGANGSKGGQKGSGQKAKDTDEKETKSGIRCPAGQKIDRRSKGGCI